MMVTHIKKIDFFTSCTHWKVGAQELCKSKSRGARPGLPVPDKPCGLSGRRATFEELEGP